MKAAPDTHARADGADVDHGVGRAVNLEDVVDHRCGFLGEARREDDGEPVGVGGEGIGRRTPSEHRRVLANRAPDPKTGAQHRRRSRRAILAEDRATHSAQAEFLEQDGSDAEIDLQETPDAGQGSTEPEELGRLLDQGRPHIRRDSARPWRVGKSLVEHQTHEAGEPRQGLGRRAAWVEERPACVGPGLRLRE